MIFYFYPYFKGRKLIDIECRFDNSSASDNDDADSIADVDEYGDDDEIYDSKYAVTTKEKKNHESIFFYYCNRF